MVLVIRYDFFFVFLFFSYDDPQEITQAEYGGIGASLDCHCHFRRRLRALDVFSLLLGRMVPSNEAQVQNHRHSHGRSPTLVSFSPVSNHSHLRSASNTNPQLKNNKNSCIAFAGVHAHYMHIYQHASAPSVEIIKPLVWQNLSLTWSLLSAMAVALKPFLKDFHTGMGMDLGYVTESHYGSGGSRKLGKQGYIMQNLSPDRSKDSQAQGEGEGIEGGYGNNNCNNGNGNGSGNGNERVMMDHTRNLTAGDHYIAEIYHESRGPSLASMCSEDPMIRKKTDIDVTYFTHSNNNNTVE